jgi:putative hemolysin
MALEYQIAILVVLLVLSGFFSGAEVALVSLSRFKARQMVERKKIGSGFVKKLKDDPQRMLSTILIGNNVVNVAASALATSIMLSIFQNYAIGIATGVMTLLILVFGEIVPKSIATQKNEITARLVSAPIWGLSLALSPILRVLDWLIAIIMRPLGIKTSERVTEEEILSLTKEAAEQGSIKDAEKKLIKNIFDFDDINVSEIAVHKSDMTTLSSIMTVGKAIDLIAGMRRKFSRVPVYGKDKDNIVGIVYVKDLLRHMAKNRNMVLSQIMKKPFFVPSNKSVSSLLRNFQHKNKQMAIVVDEHGSVTGLVTLEDVLEEIVGEITDETDRVDPNIVSIGNNMWFAKGKTDVDELYKTISLKVKHGPYDTLSGLILNQTGKIPIEGDEIIYEKFKIKVEELDGNRISKVKITAI